MNDNEKRAHDLAITLINATLIKEKSYTIGNVTDLKPTACKMYLDSYNKFLSFCEREFPDPTS